MGGIGCGMGRISGLLGFRFYFGAGVVGCCGNFVTRHGNTGCGRVGGGLGSSCGLLRCGIRIRLGRFGLCVLGVSLLCVGFCAVAGSQCGGGGENKY